LSEAVIASDDADKKKDEELEKEIEDQDNIALA
jgi:hypothetical protein